MFRRSIALLFIAALCGVTALAQDPRPPVSPGVGNAVALATNSILIERDSVVASGDLVVNNTPSGPTLGAAALAIERSSSTPAGFKLAATSVDIDRETTVRGNVYYNTLSNDGTITGSLFTPLALPVYAVLPYESIRPAGTNDIVVPPFTVRLLDDTVEGTYGNLTVGRGATVKFAAGGYAFASVTVDRDASLQFLGPADVVVNGRMAIQRDCTIGPESSSGITAASIRIQINGINGTTGALNATPSAVRFEQGNRIFANLLALNGSIVFDRDVLATGSFIARDIRVGRNARLVLANNVNQPPVANAQTVTTSGTSPLVITLTGSDPEGSALTFSIVSGPTAGTLSAITTVSPTSANVTYTPAAAGVADGFTFRVTDAGGATGSAVVSINSSPEDPPPPAPTTVIAIDDVAGTRMDTPATLLLRGTAPAGVALTFTIVSGTGPFHGSLGTLTPGSEVPTRSATVVYQPDSGYTSTDSFQFQACGVIASVTVCDTATFSLNVVDTQPDPGTTIAADVEVTTFAETEVSISLGPTSLASFTRLVLSPHAAFLQPAAIAGNVADSNANNLGDNHNALPGSVPVFMSAGVVQSGGAGSNGTVRMQMEWDISNLNVGNALQSAVVTLPTHRGSVDSLDTFFWWVTDDGDGALTDSDYEATAEQIPGVTMPVPSTGVMPIGSDASFSFSVFDEVKTSMLAGKSYFVLQGRVDEGTAGPARGLEVRTTASGNLPSNVPSLSVTTPGVTQALTYRITSLPAGGVLKDGLTPITAVPYTLTGTLVSYTPNVGFGGLDSFGFDVSNNLVTDAAVARIFVRLINCQLDREGCNNGR